MRFDEVNLGPDIPIIKQIDKEQALDWNMDEHKISCSTFQKQASEANLTKRVWIRGRN